MMKLLICILLSFPAVFGCGGKTSMFRLKDWKQVHATPTEAQVPLLEQIRNSNTRVLFVNGIAKSGGITEIFVSPDALDGVEQTLKENNVRYSLYRSKIHIAVDTKAKAVGDEESGTTGQKEVSSSQMERVDIKIPDSTNVVPIQPIEGTNLYSGLFYKLGMKRFASHSVTWTTEKTADGTGNNLQIDLNPGNQQHYEKGGKWFEDAHWAFIPTEVKGQFTLRNRREVASLTTCSRGQSASSLITWSRTPDLVAKLSNPGTPLRKSALWTPVSTKEEDLFQLKAADFPQDATVTWTESKYGDHSHYIQVSQNENHKPFYQPEGKWWNDTLFTFQEPEVELRGTVVALFPSRGEQAQPQPLSTMLSKVKPVLCQDTGKVFVIPNNSPTAVTSDLEFPVKTTNTISLTLDTPQLDHFTLIGANKLSVNTVLPTPLQFDLQALHFQSGKDKNSLEFKKDLVYNLQSEITISPNSVANVTVFVYRLEDVEVPVKGLLQVDGFVDRITGDQAAISKAKLTGHGAQVVKNKLKQVGVKEDDIHVGEVNTFIRVTGRIKANYVVNAGINNKAVLPQASE